MHPFLFLSLGTCAALDGFHAISRLSWSELASGATLNGHGTSVCALHCQFMLHSDSDAYKTLRARLRAASGVETISSP